jgi:hypothetical protein
VLDTELAMEDDHLEASFSNKMDISNEFSDAATNMIKVYSKEWSTAKLQGMKLN